MSDSNELKKQQYERFKELFALARQRYLDAGGDPQRSNGSLHNNEYLTEQERKELSILGRKLSEIRIVDGYVHCQGKSWKLPENSPLLQEEIEAES